MERTVYFYWFGYFLLVLVVCGFLFQLRPPRNRNLSRWRQNEIVDVRRASRQFESAFDIFSTEGRASFLEEERLRCPLGCAAETDRYTNDTLYKCANADYRDCFANECCYDSQCQFCQETDPHVKATKYRLPMFGGPA